MSMGEIFSQSSVGFGGKGFTGNFPAVVANTFTFTAGGPDSSGPVDGLALAGFPYGETDDIGCFCDGSTTVATIGAIDGNNPALFKINGSLIAAIGVSGIGAVQGFIIALNGILAQNFFTSLNVGPPVSSLYTTSTANYFGTAAGFPGGFSVWGWNNASASLLGLDITVVVS
jgi:hypothetical protein